MINPLCSAALCVLCGVMYLPLVVFDLGPAGLFCACYW
jgi:hypothetical protein